MEHHSMYHFSSNTKKVRGFSLVEILLVLGIIAILAIAAFIIFPQIQASSRANTEMSNIMTISSGVRNTFKGKYAGLEFFVVRAKVIPPQMIGGTPAAPTITSSWNEPVEIGEGSPTSLFRIIYYRLPSNICVKLVPGLLRNFENVDVGTTTLPKNASGGAIALACNPAIQSLVITAK